MRKAELVRALWDYMNEAGLNARQGQAAEITDKLLSLFSRTLAEREEISLAGFGKFYIQNRKATRKVHPRQPGVLIDVPERSVVRFRSFKTLQEETNTF